MKTLVNTLNKQKPNYQMVKEEKLTGKDIRVKSDKYITKIINTN